MTRDETRGQTYVHPFPNFIKPGTHALALRACASVTGSIAMCVARTLRN